MQNQSLQISAWIKAENLTGEPIFRSAWTASDELAGIGHLISGLFSFGRTKARPAEIIQLPVGDGADAEKRVA